MQLEDLPEPRIVKRRIADDAYDRMWPHIENHKDCLAHTTLLFTPTSDKTAPPKLKTRRCGKCATCKAAKLKRARGRAYGELRDAERALFVTIALDYEAIDRWYTDRGIQPLIDGQKLRDARARKLLTDGIKRIRKAIAPTTFRIGKYWERHTAGGANHGNLHCHMIWTFGPDQPLPTHRDIEIAWTRKPRNYRWRDKRADETVSQWRTAYCAFLHYQAQDQWNAATSTEERERIPFRPGFIDIKRVSSHRTVTNYVTPYVTKDPTLRHTASPYWGRPALAEAKRQENAATRHQRSSTEPAQRDKTRSEGFDPETGEIIASTAPSAFGKYPKPSTGECDGSPKQQASDVPPSGVTFRLSTFGASSVQAAPAQKLPQTQDTGHSGPDPPTAGPTAATFLNQWRRS